MRQKEQGTPEKVQTKGRRQDAAAQAGPAGRNIPEQTAGASAGNGRPTIQGEAAKLGIVPTGMQEAGAAAGNAAPRQAALPIGKAQIQAARVTLDKYKQGKANLERRIVENEQWYKLRHWACMRKAEAGQVEPSSGWLFNAIANKHADAMDNFPSPNVLPREENDKGEAEMLSSILPVVLDQADFEGTYDAVWDYKLKSGTGVYGVFWDKRKLNGLGDIAIEQIDLINLFWESGITDLQRSRNLFYVEVRSDDELVEEWPQLRGKLGGNTLNLTEYIYDDSVDTTGKSAVIDWYYKKHWGGRTVLHYCKFVNDEVLFATENDPAYQDRGWYDHGLYPFLFDPLFRVAGTPCGFGYIDVAKSAQEYIDRGNAAIMENMLSNARPRYFIRNDGSVNEKEFADMSKDFIHVDASLGQDSIVPVQGKTLNDIYVTAVNNKIDELKEVTGNRDISTGGTTSGVTAASAIAAMQEAGSKLSRDANKASYRVFRQLVLMCIELIRQFYDLPRCFRILGKDGAERYVAYSNAGIQPQMQGSEFGVDMGMRVPLFDIEVTAQKQSPYSKMSQNEMALQLYSAGFFNPQMADQALACLDMMDFDRKQFVIQKVSQNGGMYQQLLAMQQQMLTMAQIIDQDRGTNMAETMAAGITGQAMPTAPERSAAGTEDISGGESGVTRNARERVANATSPT